MALLFSSYVESKRIAILQSIKSWQSTVYSMVVFGATMVVIFWASVFLYTSFYFTFMPQESITWPIHFHFKSCGKDKGLCSDPKAVIPVLDPARGSLLVPGQKYRVVVDLEMPESPVNQKLGMFQLHMAMLSQAGRTLKESSRSSMLRYKSHLLQTISTTIFAPFLLYGIHEEKQTVTVELFSQYEEDPISPVSEVLVDLESRHVELYSAILRIHATFTGLRYFMYYYPLSAALIGIGVCMVFLSAVVILSWIQFSGSSYTTASSFSSSSSPYSLPSVNQYNRPPSFPDHSATLYKEGYEAEPPESLNEEGAEVEEVKEEAVRRPSDSDSECHSKDSSVPGRSDGEDFEVVGSKEKGVVSEDSDPLASLKTSDGESVVRQRIQNIH